VYAQKPVCGLTGPQQPDNVRQKSNRVYAQITCVFLITPFIFLKNDFSSNIFFFDHHHTTRTSGSDGRIQVYIFGCKHPIQTWTRATE
jgi:hypothetical protein